jgi:hypothetical protein
LLRSRQHILGFRPIVIAPKAFFARCSRIAAKSEIRVDLAWLAVAAVLEAV